MLERFFKGDRSDPIRGRFQVRGGRAYEPAEDAAVVRETLAGRAAAIRQGKEALITGVRVESDDEERAHRRGLQPCCSCGKPADPHVGEWFFVEGRKYCRGCAPVAALLEIPQLAESAE